MSRKRLLLFLAATLAALALTASPVLAHDGEAHAGPWWAAWSLEPGVILPLAVTLLVYLRGQRSLALRGAGRLPRLRSWAFGAGFATLTLALISPIDGLASELFWVHMLQHTLLILVAAPLLVIGYPLPPLLLGLPEGWRHGLGRFWARAAALRGLWQVLSSPLAAWLLSTFLLWAWHAPVLYQAAVENETLHALEHLSFLGSALLFWWVTLHSLGARPAYRGLGVLYLFTAMMQSGLLGALLTFSTRQWYPIYSGRAEAWGISALADQQLAGTIMWVPSGLVYLAVALWLMKTWLDSIESREETIVRKGH